MFESVYYLRLDEYLFKKLQNYLIKHSENTDDSIYILFQMFSGDELHIVSKEVIIEIVR